MEIPIYVFTGFLDSGKTTLLRDTLSSPDFKVDRTLIIACEEGEEEYDEAYLKENHAFLVTLEDEEDLTDQFLLDCARRYDPDQIMVEYNGFWKMATLLDRKLPKYWDIFGIYSTVDTSTAEGYLTNMRAMFLEQLTESGLVIFNRCSAEVDRARLRRIVKAVNPPVQVLFESEDGEVYDPADDDLPYSLEGPIIEIDDIDYGLWYLDAMEHPEHYMGKSVRFLAQVYKGRHLKSGFFVPGRFVMTCCADDIRFMGYMCRYQGDFPYKQRDWVKVTVDFGFEFVKSYGEEGPVLILKDIEPASKPEQDPVYFT